MIMLRLGERKIAKEKFYAAKNIIHNISKSEAINFLENYKKLSP